MYNKKNTGSFKNKYMTKKDYITFAKMLKEVKENKPKLTTSQKMVFNSIVYRIKNIFQNDNERFDNERFENAIYEN